MTVAEAYTVACAEAIDIQWHLPTLRDYASRAAQVIEVGVGAANSTVAFLLGLEESGGRLWSVDIEPAPIPDWLKAHPQWTFTAGDSLAHHGAAPSDVDVLFIDSEHSFAQTYAELVAYVPHVRSGGVVLLHDTGGHQPGVRQAIDLFCAEREWGWVDNPDCYGLGLIVVP